MSKSTERVMVCWRPDDRRLRNTGAEGLPWRPLRGAALSGRGSALSAAVLHTRLLGPLTDACHHYGCLARHPVKSQGFLLQHLPHSVQPCPATLLFCPLISINPFPDLLGEQGRRALLSDVRRQSCAGQTQVEPFRDTGCATGLDSSRAFTVSG